jgi:hypothetical protein
MAIEVANLILSGMSGIGIKRRRPRDRKRRDARAGAKVGRFGFNCRQMQASCCRAATATAYRKTSAMSSRGLIVAIVPLQ